MRSRLLKIAYQLHLNAWGDWPLARWLAGFALAAAGLLLLFRLPHGWARAGPGFWLVVIILLFIGLGMMACIRWAIGQDYVVFRPEEAPKPGPQALEPVDKILIRVTGRFSVEGKTHFFAHLLAYWRTFASREHAVMAIVHKTHYLGLAHMPDDYIGMWYIFWCPENMVELTPGRLGFGAEWRPGLRVRYDTPDLTQAQRRQLPLWQRRRKFSQRETIYLSFDDEAMRGRVWADLLAGAAKASQR